jgi:hypothetical protein
MFTMMNQARLGVGLEGVGVADRAYQQALAYAQERKQGRAIGKTGDGSDAIFVHPDVKRMLMRMRAQTAAARTICYATAVAIDVSTRARDPKVRADAAARAALLTPMAKGYSTDIGNEVAYLGVQVHGGMGFIEETGAAQYLRDARILTIYEGTTAIQANDLVGRKTARDGGRAAKGVAVQVAETEADLAASKSAAAQSMRKRLGAAREAFEQVVDFVVAQGKANPNAVFAGSVPYLMLGGNLVAGWQMARSLLAAERLLAHGEGDAGFLAAKIVTARFYAEHLLSRAPGQRDAIVDGAESVTAMALAAF